ncbi:MAG: hypothetical protein ACI9TH_001462 [Kiritimatiellia bacterium]|jgi:hypothetical protein
MNSSRKAWRKGPAILAGLVASTLVVTQLPHRWCARHHEDLADSRGVYAEALARQVATWAAKPLSEDDFFTGSVLFDGEWLFGTYFMAAMGFGQMAEQHEGAEKEQYLDHMAHCLEKLLSDQVRAFDSASWRANPLEDLDDPDQHHAAYLGYLNLALSLYRTMRLESPYADLNDRITASLVMRLEQSELLLLQTYPHQVYPVDNSAVIASIGLHQRATGMDASGILKRWEANFRSRYLDATSGLMIQAVDPRSGERIDSPRGSGTSLGLYFLAYSHPDLSRDLYTALHRELKGQFLGFGGVREYPEGESGTGDIDSGPIMFGFSMSATGFSLAGARMYGDEETYRALWSTAWLCGAPQRKKDTYQFITGGPLGNAILFAVCTAPLQGEAP